MHVMVVHSAEGWPKDGLRKVTGKAGSRLSEAHTLGFANRDPGFGDLVTF